MSRQVKAASDHFDEATFASEDGGTPDLEQSDGRSASGDDGANDTSGREHPLWVRWTALIVFVLVLGTTFIFLGRWQLNRLHERRANNAVIRTNEAAPVAPFSTVAGQPITHAQEYKRYQVTGTFQPSQQLIIRYRSNGDDEGYEVVTPLRTTHGKSVLIDRGFVPTQDKGDIPDSVSPPPSGKVTVVARARPSESGKRGATVPVAGHARLINAGKIGDQLGHRVVDGYLDVVSMQPADTTNFQKVELPELSDGPHFWYAVQWFMFTGIGITGVVVFIRGDVRERRAIEGPAQGQSPSESPNAPLPGPSSSGQDHPRAETADDTKQPDRTRSTAPRSSRRLRRTKPQHPVRYGDTQAPPGWKPPDST